MSSFGANNIFRDTGNSVANTIDSSNQFGRVYSVLLTDDEKDASVMKVPPGSIGAIQFKFLVKGVEDSSPITQTAYPLDARSRTFPVKNEVVEIISGPSNRVQDAESNNSQVYYYKSVVDMWGSAEHNARPNSRFNVDKNQVTGDFVEKGDVGRVKHLPGDYVIEGRFGNSIRFGSSNSKTKVSSPWSGPDSSPLVIISNGRKSKKSTFEDINKDGSSMYILSDQKIPFEPASLNFESYNVTMTAVQSAQVVKPDPVKAAEPVPVQAVPAKEPPTPPVVVDVPTKKEELKVDEVEALPEQEQVGEFQEYEPIGALHLNDNNNYWASTLTPMEPSVYENESVGGLSNYFLAYLGYQQGAGGLRNILRSVKKGLPTAPGGKAQSNMVSNVATKMRSKPLSPKTFVQYWKKQFELKSAEALRTPMPKDVAAVVSEFAIKWGIPQDYARIICFIESRYNPNAGAGTNADCIGLFQTTKTLHQGRYPKDGPNERLNARKSADVGLQYLKTMLASVPSFRKILD